MKFAVIVSSSQAAVSSALRAGSRGKASGGRTPRSADTSSPSNHRRSPRALALSAARAARIGLVGVDLLPTRNGFVILELNGAVDFRPVYAPLRDVFSDAVTAILGNPVEQRELAAVSV